MRRKGCDGTASIGQTFFDTVVEISREKLAKEAANSGDDSSKFQKALTDISGEAYSLLSLRPLLSLWRHSARQDKSGKQALNKHQLDEMQQIDEMHNTHPIVEMHNTHQIDKTHNTESKEPLLPNTKPDLDFPKMFKDVFLPLVIDVGCGWGTTLLGLASKSNSAVQGMCVEKGGEFNYLGIDMSEKCVSYARGTASRWALSSRCAFVVADVDEVLQALGGGARGGGGYPGQVHVCVCVCVCVSVCVL